MMTKSNHYIGITGVADKTELASLVESCADISVPKGYHVGGCQDSCRLNRVA